TAFFAVGGGRGAGGVLLGGGAIGISLLVYAVGLRTLLERGRPRLAIGLLSVKLLAFLGLGWLAFASGREYRPDPIGFPGGIACLPAGGGLEAVSGAGSSLE